MIRVIENPVKMSKCETVDENSLVSNKTKIKLSLQQTGSDKYTGTIVAESQRSRELDVPKN